MKCAAHDPLNDERYHQFVILKCLCQPCRELQRKQGVNGIPVSNRYNYSALTQFITALFEKAGLAPERAARMADVFIEGDLLGFTTHGTQRVACNLEWLLAGESQMSGDPLVLADHGSVFNWDANFLPGPWVVSCAIDELIARVPERGLAAATLRRSQHIASLAAYCPRILEAGYAVFMTCSTPAEKSVNAFGGIEPVFSANPIAFAAPADDYPLLFDISLSITAGGYVARALREGQRLPQQCLLDNEGNTTDDPAACFTQPPGSIMPIGGLEHGYKGYALCLLSELLSMALGGYGRADDCADDGEANSVFIQIIDPAAFGSLDEFKRQAAALRERCQSSRLKAGSAPVRVPGQRAWERRSEQLTQGVELYPSILRDIQPWADRLGVTPPPPLT